MKIGRILFAAAALSLAVVPAASAKVHHMKAPHGAATGSWDGRWAGAWGGNDPTAIIVKGGRVVAYEYGGSTNPVSSSRVSARTISYSVSSDISVTMTRTGANTAHAAIKTAQGAGTAELTRQ